MGFRFRRSVKLFPGVRLNFSMSGVSVSVGVPGATVNLSQRGNTLTLGLPGTGVSYRHNLSGRPSHYTKMPNRPPLKMHFQSFIPQYGEIRSDEVAQLTSADLLGLKKLLNEASAQNELLQNDYNEALKARKRAWKKLRRREKMPLKIFMTSRVPAARSAFDDSETEAKNVGEALSASEVSVRLPLSPNAKAAWVEVCQAFGDLSKSDMIWDITSSIGLDRVRARSIASNEVTRTSVRLLRVRDPIMKGLGEGLRFQNANGDDLDFFPGLLLMRSKSGTDYALIDFRNVVFDIWESNFVEHETIPRDAQIVGHAWAKSNKDGTPDRRFNGNYQIPIARYGQMRISSPEGVDEAYYFSNTLLLNDFGSAVMRFKSALWEQAQALPISDDELDDNLNNHEARHQLPALPAVAGANEFYSIPIALCVSAFFLYTHNFRGGAVAKTSYDPSTELVSPQTVMLPPSQNELAVQKPVVTVSESQKAERTNDRDRSLQTTTGANIRSSPDRSSAIIREAHKGEEFTLFAERAGWVLIGRESPEGWIYHTLLRPIRPHN